MLRAGPAWAAAVLATAAVACTIQSWQLQAELTDLTGKMPSDAALRSGFLDFVISAVPVLLVFALALAAAFSTANRLKARLPLFSPIMSPLAVAAAVAAALWFNHALFPAMSMADVRWVDGIILLCLAAPMGTLIFSWLKPQ